MVKILPTAYKLTLKCNTKVYDTMHLYGKTSELLILMAILFVQLLCSFGSYRIIFLSYLVAVKTGEACDRRIESCLSPFAICTTGICKCNQYFSPTIDGRCRVTKTRYIGESCRGSEECEYPGTCVNGKCACVEPQRELTSEEFWLDPSLTIQCRPKSYSTCK